MENSQNTNVQETSQPSQPSQQSANTEEPAYLGELEKLGQLRDQGVITEEEFAAKKKQLMGL
jgi:hypothetical protein